MLDRTDRLDLAGDMIQQRDVVLVGHTFQIQLNVPAASVSIYQKEWLVYALGAVLHALEIPLATPNIGDLEDQPGQRHFDALNLVLCRQVPTRADIGLHD